MLIVHDLGSSEDPEKLEQLVELVHDRISQSFPVILRERDALPGMSLIAYRFQHTGDPVTQAVIVFADRQNTAYVVEITGHQKDEKLLLGEARQVLHSIER